MYLWITFKNALGNWHHTYYYKLIYNLKLSIFILITLWSTLLSCSLISVIRTSQWAIEMHWTDSVFSWTLSCY